MEANDLEFDDDIGQAGTARYVPTPEQIRQACAKIRAEWSESESRRRGAYQERVSEESEEEAFS